MGFFPRKLVQYLNGEAVYIPRDTKPNKSIEALQFKRLTDMKGHYDEYTDDSSFDSEIEEIDRKKRKRNRTNAGYGSDSSDESSGDEARDYVTRHGSEAESDDEEDEDDGPVME